MKNLKPISPFRRGAMQATRSSLQAAAEHVFIPPGSGIFTKWIMALLAIMLCVPALAQTTTLAEADCDLTVKTADGVPYVCIESIKAEGDLYVPSTIHIASAGETYPVYAVNTGNGNIASITFAADIREVFFSCSKAKKIVFEGDDTRVAFDFTNSILTEEIRFPANLTEFGGFVYLSGSEKHSNCFRNAYHLKSVELPKKLKTINDEMFNNCNNLASIDIPPPVTEIGYAAFYGCSALNGITLPASLTTIGNSAFRGCKALKSLDIPSTVSSIGSMAFLACSGLENIDLSSLTYLADELLEDCYGLKSVTIGKGLKSIGSSTFSGCTQISSLPLPEGLESIGENAFKGCKSLTEATLPSTLTTLGNGAYENCYNIKNATVPNSITKIPDKTFMSCHRLTTIRLPETLTTIGAQAFDGCNTLESVTLPSTVRYIERRAFADCSALKHVTWPESLQGIRDRAFIGTAMPSIKLPESVSSISELAFAENMAITSFAYPKNVEDVTNAFQGCTNLTEIVLPENAKTIYNQALAYTGVRKVTIPEGVTTMWNYVFSNCTNLEVVMLPSTLAYLKGKEMFYKCSSLKAILNHAVTAPTVSLPENLFEWYAHNATLYIPIHSSGYDSNGWEKFTKRKVAPGIVTMQSPTFSKESGATDDFLLTLTNPNATGRLYYKVVPKDAAPGKVSFAAYTEPVVIDGSCTVWAYVIDGYDASEYVSAEYEVGVPQDGKVQLVVCGTYVSVKNAHDVLGEGSTAYDIKEQVLTLDNASLNADEHEYNTAIQADGGHLTIRVKGNCSLTASAYGLLVGASPGFGGKGADATIVGDGNSVLTITVTDEHGDGIYSYLGNVTIDNCKVVVKGGYTGLFMKSGPDNGTLTVKGDNAVLDLTASNSAMENVQRLVLGETLGITEPDGAVFENGCIVLGNERQKHAVIARKKGGDVGVAGIRSDDNKADTRIYSVQGVRVTRPSVPGVYIVNGRKYVVR